MDKLYLRDCQTSRSKGRCRISAAGQPPRVGSAISTPPPVCLHRVSSDRAFVTASNMRPYWNAEMLNADECGLTPASPPFTSAPPFIRAPPFCVSHSMPCTTCNRPRLGAAFAKTTLQHSAVPSCSNAAGLQPGYSRLCHAFA